MKKEYETESGWWRDLGLALGLVKGRTERTSYNFTGNSDDPEWKRFKRDVEKDKLDGLL